METWAENLCGREVKFGLRTERNDDEFWRRCCPCGAWVTICFRPYGLVGGFESIKFNTLFSDYTNESAVAELIRRHGTHGVFGGFVDEF